jgi:transcriptional regulator with XRE-family HTH domain
MANRIRELREAMGMTQLRLSIELEVTQETVSAYETGKHYASLKSLIKMSNIFDASMDYIMGLSPVRRPMLHTDLTNAEIEVLITYRKMNCTQREKTVAYMQGLLA